MLGYLEIANLYTNVNNLEKLECNTSGRKQGLLDQCQLIQG